MLLNGEFFVAVRCGICSKIEIYELSLFQLAKNKSRKIGCLCGNTEFTIKVDKNRKLYLTISCVACGSKHVFKYTIKEILSGRGYIEQCNLTKYDILWIGKKDWIEKAVEKANQEVEKMIKELGFDDYFHSPEIMIASLDVVHQIAEQQNLYCDCGSRDIDMSLYADRIELRCMKCNSINVIYAETREDLNNLINIHQIVMHERTFACIDAICYKGKMNNQ
jgi:hypothetical protein